MAIQPIDLQNMYSQMSNVAKSVAGQSQAAQLADSMQQQSIIQKNLENSTKVQKTGENANANSVNENGHKGATFSSGAKRNNNNQSETESEDEQKTKYPENPYLGTIIDIMR
jgi:Trm5-related predicted tRNA methylase